MKISCLNIWERKSYERTGWRYLVLEKFSTLNKNAEQNLKTWISIFYWETKTPNINLPSFRIYSNSIGLASHISQQSGAVGAIELSYIDGVPQASPMSSIVAKPVHSRMISPINISCNPVNCNVSRPFKFRTLEETEKSNISQYYPGEMSIIFCIYTLG